VPDDAISHCKNRDLDTGKAVAPGEYAYTDRTYDTLLLKLAKSNFENVSPDLSADILRFYSAMPAPDPHGVAPALEALKAFNSSHSTSKTQ